MSMPPPRKPKPVEPTNSATVFFAIEGVNVTMWFNHTGLYAQREGNQPTRISLQEALDAAEGQLSLFK